MNALLFRTHYYYERIILRTFYSERIIIIANVSYYERMSYVSFYSERIITNVLLLLLRTYHIANVLLLRTYHITNIITNVLLLHLYLSNKMEFKYVFMS